MILGIAILILLMNAVATSGDWHKAVDRTGDMEWFCWDADFLEWMPDVYADEYPNVPGFPVCYPTHGRYINVPHHELTEYACICDLGIGGEAPRARVMWAEHHHDIKHCDCTYAPDLPNYRMVKMYTTTTDREWADTLRGNLVLPETMDEHLYDWTLEDMFENFYQPLEPEQTVEIPQYAEEEEIIDPIEHITSGEEGVEEDIFEILLPGFEAIFAIAGLLAVAYPMTIRRKK